MNLTECGWGQRYSPLAMNNAPVQLGWQKFDQHKGDAPVRNQPETFTWRSERMGKERQIWLYRPSETMNEKLPLVILQDGEFWAMQMPVFSALEVNTDSGYLAPAVYALIDTINHDHRSVDLPCNPDYWLAILEELLPQIEARYPVSTDACETVVAGQSYGGLTSMYAALNWPQRFGCVLSQSGSFWWPDTDRIRPPDGKIRHQTHSKPVEIARFIREQFPAKYSLKVFMEAGEREGAMIAINQQVCDALKSRSRHRIQFKTYDGRHERYCWRGGLIDGLHFLLN